MRMKLLRRAQSYESTLTYWPCTSHRDLPASVRMSNLRVSVWFKSGYFVWIQNWFGCTTKIHRDKINKCEERQNIALYFTIPYRATQSCSRCSFCTATMKTKMSFTTFSQNCLCHIATYEAEFRYITTVPFFSVAELYSKQRDWLTS